MHKASRYLGMMLAVLPLATAPLSTSWMPLALLPRTPTFTYPSDRSFNHETGLRTTNGWSAYYREHHPGYLVKGLKNGGEILEEGTFQYRCFFALRSGHLSGLLSAANDVVRLEVVDTTAHETLITRTFQMADFKRLRKELLVRSITFSTWGRAGHRFEPRIYWHGLSGIFLQRIELFSLGPISFPQLEAKAAAFELMMSSQFIDRGFVVVRDDSGASADLGDTAIWTGLYAAAEAWRYKATQQEDALKQLQTSLWTLHRLPQLSPVRGTLVRHVNEEGRPLEQSSSKDTYTGFFYGIAQGFPYVESPTLKKALRADIQNVVSHFLDNDLSFMSARGSAVDLNPYPDARFVAEAVQALHTRPNLRRDLARAFRLAQVYFWIHGERPPTSFAPFIDALKHPQSAEYETELLPLLNGIHAAIRQFQRPVHQSAVRGSQAGFSDTPYIKLDLIFLRTLNNLDTILKGHEITSFEELKILPSQALHALHFLKVAAEILPKPNRFDDYYRDNLFKGKALLKTAMLWHQIDEDAFTAVAGETEANTRRTSSSHLSFLALHDLILLEKDPMIRFQYQKLFEIQYAPMRTDGNAMIDAMHAGVGLSTPQLGLAWWSLMRYPMDRHGKGPDYWVENKDAILKAFGGEVNGQAREALPPDLRPRDAFIWQRSAHSIRGDFAGWEYPPLDYLFAYWLARTANTPRSSED